MENPKPDQILNYPLGGEVKHLFTKTLKSDDMWCLPLIKSSIDFILDLPRPLLGEIVTNGLDIEIFTPIGRRWAQILYEKKFKKFRVKDFCGCEIDENPEFKVGDTIDCWSLYHQNVGPYGILSLLIQKVIAKNAISTPTVKSSKKLVQKTKVSVNSRSYKSKGKEKNSVSSSMVKLNKNLVRKAKVLVNSSTHKSKDIKENVASTSKNVKAKAIANSSCEKSKVKMAPTRKKSVNKRFLSEVSPDKEVKNSNKKKHRVDGKWKLFDKLGPQWRKEELTRFYQAYRTYGKDWKKVSAEVHNRSVEMVESLYNMNRAYLSLPEGMASAVGLIAMMTDHYTVLERSDSEQESDGKPHKRKWDNEHESHDKSLKLKRVKAQPSPSKDKPMQSNSITSNDGYLSLLKRGHIDGCQPRAVGKRTPRFPISYTNTNDDRGNFVSPKTKGQRSEIDANDDEGAHVAALALAEASQRGGSPQVSRTPHRKSGHIGSSPVRSWDRTILQPDSAPTKLRDASMHEDWLEGGTGSRGAEMEGVGTVEVHRKGKKFYGKKVRVEEIGNSHIDDDGEACSGTEGQKVSALKGKVDIEVSNAKNRDTSPCSQRRRNKKIFIGDEFSGFDALQTLANISALESESSVLLSEEKTTLDVDDKSRIPEAMSSGQHRDKVKLVRPNEKVSEAIGGVESSNLRKSKLSRRSATSTKSVSEQKQQPQSVSSSLFRKKRQPSTMRVSNAEAPTDSKISKPLDTEASHEGEYNSPVKCKQTGQTSVPSEQLKSASVSERSFSGERKSPTSDLAGSMAQVPASVPCKVALPTGRRSKHKMELKKALLRKEGDNILVNRANKFSISLQDRAKKKLSFSLLSPMVRRWCAYEWFYSALDYPWFAQREFLEYLDHVGLGHVPRLTRVEWGVIRSSLGKPRRFCGHFILEERKKLEQYRESVRKHYTELRTGVREGLPTDLARPLSVGQRVIALHPKTGEISDGGILTVDYDRCRVQFDCPEMGVEFIKDVDCMPANPFENMPEALKRERLSVISKELQVDGCSINGGLTSTLFPENTLAKQAQVDANHAILQAKAVAVNVGNAQKVARGQPSVGAQVQAKEADMQTLSELSQALDKMGSAALQNLRQPNTCSANSMHPLLKPSTSTSSPSGLMSSHDNSVSQESGSTVGDIVRSSRVQANAMVNTAVKAFMSLKEGEVAFEKVGEALDSMDKRQSALESKVIGSADQANGSLRHHNQLNSNTSEPQVNGDASGHKSNDDSDKIESAIPSELITSCVSTFLMIQKCAERQYPPAEVAQIIDSAVASLLPCCSQNLPIYREIQAYMGRIKTQLLALIPT